jgi:hypothetical protein
MIMCSIKVPSLLLEIQYLIISLVNYWIFGRYGSKMSLLQYWLRTDLDMIPIQVLSPFYQKKKYWVPDQCSLLCLLMMSWFRSYKAEMPISNVGRFIFSYFMFCCLISGLLYFLLYCWLYWDACLFWLW